MYRPIRERLERLKELEEVKEFEVAELNRLRQDRIAELANLRRSNQELQRLAKEFQNCLVDMQIGVPVVFESPIQSRPESPEVAQARAGRQIDYPLPEGSIEVVPEELCQGCRLIKRRRQ